MRCRTILGLCLLCCCRCKDLRAEAAGGQRRKDSPCCEHAEAAAAPARRVNNMSMDRSWEPTDQEHALHSRPLVHSICVACPTRQAATVQPASSRSAATAHGLGAGCRQRRSNHHVQLSFTLDACTRCTVKVLAARECASRLWLPTPPLILTVIVKLQHVCAGRILIGRMGFCVVPICLSMSQHAPPPVSIRGELLTC